MSSPAAVVSRAARRGPSQADQTEIVRRKQTKILTAVWAAIAEGKPYHVQENVLFNLRYFPQGLPDVIRRLLATIHRAHPELADHAPAALVWDLWHVGLFAGEFDPNQPVTVRDFVSVAAAVGWETPRATIEKGMELLEAAGVLQELCILLIERYREGIIDPLHDQTPVGVSKFLQKSNPSGQTGRTPRVLFFQPIELTLTSLIAFLITLIREHRFAPPGRAALPDAPNTGWFGADPLAIWKVGKVAEIDNERVTAAAKAKAAKVAELVAAETATWRGTLSMESVAAAPSLRIEGPIHNARDYRIALLRATVESNPDRTISTVAAAKEVGISRQSLTAYYERAGVKRVSQWRAVLEITRSGGYVLEQCNKAGRGAKAALNNPAAWLIAIDGGGDDKPTAAALSDNRGTCRVTGKVDLWVSQQFHRGRRVYLCVQIHSRDVLADKPQRPAQREPDPARPPQPPPSEDDPPVTPKPKREPSKRGKVWRGYSRHFKDTQLAVRRLRDKSDGLIDLETGEVMTPHVLTEGNHALES